ncbi:MAG: aspartate/glutamate racemase family protein [Chromatiales bacterium]|nr:aspartate/glutamate racemase family protein [Chromatiales bacterium]
MKTVGLLGGMSWESTQIYYQLLNEGIKQRLGGLHSAKVVLYSVDFAEIERLQHQGAWEETAAILSSAAQLVERGGADFLLVCTNTMHKVADQVADSITIPLLHLADATAEHIKRQGMSRVGLLGTRFTMEQAFYVGRLQQHGLEVLTPDEPGRERVHRIIYDELCLGEINEVSRRAYREIIDSLVEQGAEGIILGCTEIGMLVKQSDSAVPLFDTTAIHVQAAIEAALSDMD